MKLHLILAMAAAFLVTPAWAQSTAPAADTPVTAVCKDGTQFSGKTLRGACRGHGGVDKGAKKAATAEQQAGAPAAAAAAPATKAEKRAKPEKTAAATPSTGQPGEVWVNTESKVFHCQGSRFYGKTKQGKYMSQQEALAQGFHAAKEKACSAG